MIKIKNYWRHTSPKIKKLSLWLKSTIGVLALSAYAQSEVKIGFYLLIAGALIDGVMQLLPPDQDTNKPTSAIKEGAVIIMLVLFSALLLSSCGVIKPGTDRTKTDTTTITYNRVDLKIKGAKVFTGLNMDSLYHAALMAKDQRSEDSIAWLNIQLNYKRDSIAALSAGGVMPTKPLLKPLAPQKQFLTDPQTKAQLSYWIDAYGKLQLACESKDQTVQTLQPVVNKTTKDVTKSTVIVTKTPTWNWIAIAVLATLLAISVIINLINRNSKNNG